MRKPRGFYYDEKTGQWVYPPISRKLVEYSDYLQHLESQKLGDEYVIIGGMSVGRWQKMFGIRIPDAEDEITSKDVDIRGRAVVHQSLSKLFGKAPIEFTVGGSIKVNRFEIVVNDYRRDLNKRIEVSEALPFIDLSVDENIPRQGIVSRLDFRSVEGKGPEKISVIDPVSTLLNKLQIRKFGEPRENDLYHIQFLCLCVPQYLDLASKDFQDGKLNRNPAILAKRFLTELPNIKEKYALPDFPGFDVVEKACKYYAGNEKRIHF